MACRITASAARSATVTGEASALVSTASRRRKCGRMASRARSARWPAKATSSSAERKKAGTSLIAAIPAFWKRRKSLGRQRRRIVREAPQIGDQVGALLGVLRTGIGHLGAGGIGLRVLQELVQRVIGPGTLGALERVGVGEAVRMALRGADDVGQVGADLVGAAGLDGVAGGAFGERLLAGFRIGARQQGGHRRVGLFLLAGSGLARGLGAVIGHIDLVGGFGQ